MECINQLRAQFDVRAKPLGQQPLYVGQAEIRHDARCANATGSTKRNNTERNIAHKIQNFRGSVMGFSTAIFM